MANPPRRFRVDGRLDEPVLQIPLWPDDVVDQLGIEPRSSAFAEVARILEGLGS
jgi:hypothetical protein